MDNIQINQELDINEPNNYNENQFDNNNIYENQELEQIKNELEAKNNEILSLRNDLNFYKEKNEELNSELDKIKSQIINNDINQNEINNLKQDIDMKDKQIEIINEENKQLKNNVNSLVDFIVNSLSPLGITIPELLLINDFKSNKEININVDNNEQTKDENINTKNIFIENNNFSDNNFNKNLEFNEDNKKDEKNDLNLEQINIPEKENVEENMNNLEEKNEININNESKPQIQNDEIKINNLKETKEEQTNKVENNFENEYIHNATINFAELKKLHEVESAEVSDVYRLFIDKDLYLCCQKNNDEPIRVKDKPLIKNADNYLILKHVMDNPGIKLNQDNITTATGAAFAYDKGITNKLQSIFTKRPEVKAAFFDMTAQEIRFKGTVTNRDLEKENKKAPI